MISVIQRLVTKTTVSDRFRFPECRPWRSCSEMLLSPATFPFADLEILLLQRMAGKQAATAASRSSAGSRFWAVREGDAHGVWRICCFASEVRREPNLTDAAQRMNDCFINIFFHISEEFSGGAIVFKCCKPSRLEALLKPTIICFVTRYFCGTRCLSAADIELR